MKNLAYYYCSLPIFLNILKEKEIYLSDPLKMNDREEIEWYLKQLAEISTKEKNDFAEGLRGDQTILSEIDFKELIEILRTKGQRSVYVGCFSKEPDILSQWRSYADDGQGVCIGFDLKALVKQMRAANMEIATVKYQRSISKIDLNYIEQTAISEVPMICSERKITNHDDQLEILLHELIPLFVKFKNPAFKEENEVRLIYCDDLKFEHILDEHGFINEPWENKLPHDFRYLSSNTITEYVKLCIDPTKLVYRGHRFNVIKALWLGPKCSLTEHDGKRIVEHYMGEAPEVHTSGASYR